MTIAPPILPPTASQKRKSLRGSALVIGAILVLLLGGYSAVHGIIASGITKGPDAMFGDQHLKTAVALIELHKVRFGKYPETLQDLKFTGQWDQIALGSVAYYPSPDRTKYYIEVKRGWIGKPTLVIADEFWQGTGYSPRWKPKDE